MSNENRIWGHMEEIHLAFSQLILDQEVENEDKRNTIKDTTNGEFTNLLLLLVPAVPVA